MSESHPHERHNREFWDADADDYQAVHGGDLTARPLAWGAWRIPETELGVLGDGTIDFQFPHSEWFRVFREHGFSVEDFIELQPPEDATTTYDDFAPYDWARRWPAEQIWKVRKRA